LTILTETRRFTGEFFIKYLPLREVRLAGRSLGG